MTTMGGMGSGAGSTGPGSSTPTVGSPGSPPGSPFNGVFGDSESGTFDIEMGGDELLELLDEQGFKPGETVQDEILDYLDELGIDLTDADFFDVNITDVRPDGTFDLEFSTCINTEIPDKVFSDQETSNNVLDVKMEKGGESVNVDYTVESFDCKKITFKLEFADPSDIGDGDQVTISIEKP